MTVIESNTDCQAELQDDQNDRLLPDTLDDLEQTQALGVRLGSLGPPAEHHPSGLFASPVQVKRLHSTLSTDQLREDLVRLVEISDCPHLDQGLRATCAAEARHVMATLLARARADGFEGSGSGLPDIVFDNGRPADTEDKETPLADAMDRMAET